MEKLNLGGSSTRSATGECDGPHPVLDDLDTVVRMVDLIKKFADDSKMGQRVATDKARENLQKE
jgi:hypothetical protein